MKAVFVDCTPELASIISARSLSVPDYLHVHCGDPSDEELLALIKDADVVLVEHTQIAEQVLDQATGVKEFVFMGTGAESYLPVAKLRQRGALVHTVPGYGDRAVAEHAMALTFAGARRVAQMDRQLRHGIWRPLGGVQLWNAKVAVIGLGGIGSTYAAMAAALGMKVAGWNRSKVDSPFFIPDLEDALRNADFVSLHLALNEQTTHIIDAPQLALLKPGSVLVNTARANLVNEVALADAIASGQVGHAGLDVFWNEPLTSTSSWCTADGATLTAHAAYMTDDAYVELWRRTIDVLDGTITRPTA